MTVFVDGIKRSFSGSEIGKYESLKSIDTLAEKAKFGESLVNASGCDVKMPDLSQSGAANAPSDAGAQAVPDPYPTSCGTSDFTFQGYVSGAVLTNDDCLFDVSGG